MHPHEGSPQPTACQRARKHWHAPYVTAIPAKNLCQVWLRGFRILAVDGPPGILQKRVHLPQVRRWRAVGPNQAGHLPGKAFALQPLIDRTLLGGPGLVEPIPPSLQAVFVPPLLLCADAALQGCGQPSRLCCRRQPVWRARHL